MPFLFNIFFGDYRTVNLMKRIFLYGCLLAIAGLTGYLLYVNSSGEDRPSSFMDHIRNVTPLQSKKPVFLYFSEKEGRTLTSEERMIPFSEDPSIFAKSILEALIEGPRRDLIRTIPEGVVVNAVFISPDNIAYVDLSKAVQENHPGGAGAELTTIYSIVNSLTLNIPEIRKVKLLAAGREILTLAGHVSLEAPLGANMMMIR